MTDIYRPDTLTGYIGNEQVKRNLGIWMTAAKSQNRPLDHMLVTGNAGSGKTTVARIVAHELGVKLHQAKGEALKSLPAMVSLLLSVGKREVLFIDEIHELPPSVATVLYTALEDRRVDISVGDTVITNLSIPLPAFTVIAATNRPHKMSDAIRQRFTLKARLGYYTPLDLAKILANVPVSIAIDAYGALEVARRSQGTPRIALANFRQSVLYATAKNVKLTQEIAAEAMDAVGIDNLGCDDNHRLYLTALINKAAGGPRGFTAMCNFLNKEEGEVEDIEGWLFHEDLVQLTDEGRVATDRAYDHMKQFIPVKSKPKLGRALEGV
jgi:holliday junction DNA helicase RuvB